MPTTSRCSISTGSSTSVARPSRALPSHLADARKAGMRLAFVTNNASRPADDVAAHLRDLGVEAETDDVVTSAQAAARVLRDRFGEGAAVALLGGRGLEAALRAEGLVPVAVGDDAVALVVGLRPRRAVARRHAGGGAGPRRAALGGQQHRPDHPDGLRHGAGPRRPGRPAERVQRRASRWSRASRERPLLDETIRRVGGSRPLMVGDRLDTDIDGAHQRRAATACW